MKNQIIKTFIICFVFSIYSCSNSSNNSNSKEFINAEKEIEPSNEVELKIIELGEFIDNAILDQDIEGYLSKLDIDYFLNKTTHSIGLSRKEKVGFKEGLSKGVSSLPREIMSKVSEGQLYDFVSYRYDTSQNAYYILFRFFSEEEGINYHDYRVSRNGDQFMFNDIFIYLTGENLSQTMERILISGMPSNSLIALLKPEKKRDMERLIQASKALRLANFQEAYDAYNSLEGDMKNEKFVLIMKAQVAIKIDEDLYEETIKELIQTYPNDNTISLNFIDYYIINEEYQKALEAIHNLKEETGDDFLEYILGNINYQKEDYTFAKNNFKLITENYESFATGYLSYMSCLVKDNEYKEVIPLLNKLLTLDYTRPELIEYLESIDEFGGNEYEDFILSKVYLDWKN